MVPPSPTPAFFFFFPVSLGRNGHSSDGLSSLATWGDESLSEAELDLPHSKAEPLSEALSRAGFMQPLRWWV